MRRKSQQIAVAGPVFPQDEEVLPIRCKRCKKVLKVPRQCVTTGEYPESVLEGLADFIVLHLVTCHYAEYQKTKVPHGFFEDGHSRPELN